QGKERAVRIGLVADAAVVGPMILIGVLGGSLTILAEATRGLLLYSIELFAFVVMRRIHRGVLIDLEFGTGKLEEVANLMIGAGMLGGGIWVVFGAIGIAAGQRPVGTPFGLAMAAAIGSVNLYLNLVAWDVIRRAPGIAGSLIMQAQLNARSVKLASSVL